MTAAPHTPTLKLARTLFAVFAPCALVLGLWLLLAPQSLASLLAIDPAADKTLATLYGAVLMAVGTGSACGFMQPQQHLSLLLFIGSYKSFAAVMLLGRYRLWPGSDNMPFSTAWIALLYALMAAACLSLYIMASRDKNHA